MRQLPILNRSACPGTRSLNIVLTGSDVEDSPLTFEIVDNPAHGSLSGSGANQTYTPTARLLGDRQLYLQSL